MKLREIKIAKEKEGKMRSAKIRVSTWMSDTDSHEWDKLQEETARLIDKNEYGSSVFRSAWVGAQVRQWAKEKGYTDNDLLERIEEALGRTPAQKVRQDRINEKSLSSAAMIRGRCREGVLQREQEFDEMLMNEMTAIGASEFIQAYSDLEDFDPRAWMARVGMTYSLPWREKVNMLLSLYLTENGPTQKAVVIKWAMDINLIGGDVTVNDFTVAASQLGFSGAAEYGKWAVPIGHVLGKALENVDIKSVTDATLMTAVTTDDTILIG